MDKNQKTQNLIIKHCEAYPKLEIEDIFKYLHQSALGCEHLVSSESEALKRISSEYATVSKDGEPKIEELDGEYSRVFLSNLSYGLTPETLAKLFFLSAKKEPHGILALEEKIRAVKALAEDGMLPFESEKFKEKLDEWKKGGYSALHHSEAFRNEYRPAYRVIANRYASFLNIFSKIDTLLKKATSR